MPGIAFGINRSQSGFGFIEGDPDDESGAFFCLALHFDSSTQNSHDPGAETQPESHTAITAGYGIIHLFKDIEDGTRYLLIPIPVSKLEGNHPDYPQF